MAIKLLGRLAPQLVFEWPPYWGLGTHCKQISVIGIRESLSFLIGDGEKNHLTAWELAL
jgi:hypothetical protein